MSIVELWACGTMGETFDVVVADKLVRSTTSFELGQKAEHAPYALTIP